MDILSWPSRVNLAQKAIYHFFFFQDTLLTLCLSSTTTFRSLSAKLLCSQPGPVLSQVQDWAFVLEFYKVSVGQFLEPF